MELFVLVLVNFVCALGMYLLFSFRFSRALDKAAANPISSEVRKSVQGTVENLEAAIEFINTTVESFEEKKRTFYLLVRKSEEIAERLEKSLEKARRRKIVVSESDQTALNTLKSAIADTSHEAGDAKPPAPRAGTRDPLSDTVDEAVSAAERALKKMGPDNVRITTLPTRAEEIVRSEKTPAVSSYFLEGAVPSAEGILSRMGRFAGRLIGLDFKSFQSMVGGPAAGSQTETLAEEEKSALDAARQVPDFARLIAEEVQRELSRRQETAKVKSPREISDRLEISAEGRQSVTLPQERADRIDFVRSLIEEGQAPENISVRTGLTLSEVNLMRSLPVPQARPRRHRLTSELGPN